MKFSQLGQLALASAVSAALVLGITACGQSNTIDFIYIASANANPGQIFAYAADGESGALTQILGSPFPAGRNPIALLTTPNNNVVFALNHDDNTVIEYIVGSDGKLFSQNTYNIQAGTNPNGMAVSPDGKTLYVVEAYGLAANNTPFNPTTPGIGALIQFPINADGSLGTEVSYPTCNNPVAVTVLGSASNTAGGAVYVVNDPAGQLTSLIDTVAAQNRGATGSATVTYPAVGACSGGTAAVGQISSYVINSDNSLTPGAGSPFAAGVAPNAIATDPTNRFVYVTDFKQNLILSYSVQGSGGTIVPLSNSTTPTGNLPSAVIVDPRGKFIYASNYLDGTVSGYALNGTTGVPSALAGASSTSATDPGPAAIAVENSIGRYIYTANFIGNSVSGLLFDPNAGTTQIVQNSPFPGAAKATAVATVKHGDHAIQVNPMY
ncbi:MAG TPA: beta-propeller fold lactonase family protein [Acidobacteriaceae bacterium]|jgi:6-phosphogluconolactonase (cycloisomerase 2 family)|nr:beta-propeller fold lactonase family protein [Acidobacteriaceae bacterium]